MPFVMPFVLYALGAALLGWSALTIVRTEGFGALDIAATLAGAGVLSIGLGAVAAAVSRAGGRIAEALASRSETDTAPADPEPGESAWIKPDVDPAPAATPPAPAPAPRLGALPAAPTLEEPPATLKERTPPPFAPSRSEAAMAVKRGLRPTIQVTPPKRESSLAATASSAPEFPLPRSVSAKAAEPTKPAQERRPWPVVQPPEPAAADAVVAPEPAASEIASPAPAAEPVPPQPVAAEPPAPVRPALPPAERRPRPAPIEKKSAPVVGPTLPLEQSAAVEAEPAAAAESKPQAEAPPAEPSGATTPEWLLRARARREARAKAESEAAAGAPEPPAAVEPEAQPEADETTVPDGAEQPRVVLREGEHNGVTYRFLEGGAIEAESQHGTRHFASIEELKATVARARGDRGDPDAPFPAEDEPTTEADALDAAISALEDAPSGQSEGRPA